MEKKEFFLIQSSTCDKLDSYDLRHMNFYERIKNFPWIRSDIEYLETRAMFLYKVFVFVLSHDEIVIDTVWIFCEKMKASIYVEAAEFQIWLPPTRGIAIRIGNGPVLYKLFVSFSMKINIKIKYWIIPLTFIRYINYWI